MKVNSKNYNQVITLAEQNGLETRELTSGTNSYPENLRMCITGFDSYEQAEAFAKKTGGEVTSIRRRDGWQLSESEGWVVDGYDHQSRLQKDHECDCIDFVTNDNIDSYLDDVKDVLKQRIDDAEDFDDLHGVVANILAAQEVANKVDALEDDEFIFVLNGDAEVCKERVTHYHHDVWSYDIAVEYETLDDITTMEDLGDYINSCADICNDYPDADIETVCDREGWTLGDDDVVCYDDYSKLVISEGAKVIDAVED